MTGPADRNTPADRRDPADQDASADSTPGGPNDDEPLSPAADPELVDEGHGRPDDPR